MADINDLDYGDYVRVNHATYLVFNNDWETRAAGLIPIDLLAQYAHNEDALSEHEVYVPARRIEKIPPVKADESVLRSLFRLEVMPWQLVEQGQYPFGSVTGKRGCFYEAKEGIELRIKKHKGFGDEVVLKNVLKAIDGLNMDACTDSQ